MAYSDKKKKRFLESLEAMGGNIKAACKAEKINRAVYYKWVKVSDPISFETEDEDGKIVMINRTFQEAALEIIEGKTDDVESFLFNRCIEGDTTAIIFYLKTKGKDRGYSERIEYKEIDPFEDRFRDQSDAEIAEQLKKISDKIGNSIS